MLIFIHGLLVISVIVTSLFNLISAEKEIIYAVLSNGQQYQQYNWSIGNESIFRVYLNNYVESGSILNFKVGKHKIKVWKEKMRVILKSNTERSNPVFIEHKMWYLCEIIFTQNSVTLKLNEESRTVQMEHITSVTGFSFGYVIAKSFMIVGCAKNPTWNNKPLDVSYDKINQCIYLAKCFPKCINAVCSYKQWDEIGCICRWGYSPVNQTTCKPRECSQEICKNGGKCQQSSFKIPKCFCRNNFTGRSCSCPPNYCHNGGKCYEDEFNELKCKCLNGFLGKRCLCTHNFCSINGNCIEFDNGTSACKCNRGSTGPNCLCNRKICSINGKCVQTSPSSFKCVCKSGFTGKRCLCSPRYCKNNGECINTNNEVSCKCVDGYFGRRCRCSKDLCSNQGSCVELKNDLTQCKCQNGYSGATCKCHINHCIHGKCIEQKNGIINCLCDPGYTGNRCKCSSEYCNNKGTCIENGTELACFCNKGYYGERCACSEDYCKNNVTCSEVNGKAMCNCLAQINDTKCACSDKYCNNNGICLIRDNKLTCKCKEGFNGENCQYSLKYCNYNGLPDLSTGKPLCACFPGYYGDRCGCTNYSCLNNGTCVSNDSSILFQCLCNSGYFGQRCMCHPNYCGKRGQCSVSTDRKSTFCNCSGGYFGPSCLCHSTYCPENASCVVDTHNNKPGYLKPNCMCHKDYCFNQGECLVNSDTKKLYCNCTGIFEGPRCVCSKDICLNGGFCKPNTNSYNYTCICINGYHGSNCEISFMKHRKTTNIYNIVLWIVFVVTFIVILTICFVGTLQFSRLIFSDSSALSSKGVVSSMKFNQTNFFRNIARGDNASNARPKSQVSDENGSDLSHYSSKSPITVKSNQSSGSTNSKMKQALNALSESSKVNQPVETEALTSIISNKIRNWFTTIKEQTHKKISAMSFSLPKLFKNKKPDSDTKKMPIQMSKLSKFSLESPEVLDSPNKLQLSKHLRDTLVDTKSPDIDNEAYKIIILPGAQDNKGTIFLEDSKLSGGQSDKDTDSQVNNKLPAAKEPKKSKERLKIPKLNTSKLSKLSLESYEILDGPVKLKPTEPVKSQVRKKRPKHKISKLSKISIEPYEILDGPVKHQPTSKLFKHDSQDSHMDKKLSVAKQHDSQDIHVDKKLSFAKHPKKSKARTKKPKLNTSKLSKLSLDSYEILDGPVKLQPTEHDSQDIHVDKKLSVAKKPVKVKKKMNKAKSSSSKLSKLSSESYEILDAPVKHQPTSRLFEHDSQDIHVDKELSVAEHGKSTDIQKENQLTDPSFIDNCMNGKSTDIQKENQLPDGKSTDIQKENQLPDPSFIDNCMKNYITSSWVSSIRETENTADKSSSTSTINKLDKVTDTQISTKLFDAQTIHETETTNRSFSKSLFTKSEISDQKKLEEDSVRTEKYIAPASTALLAERLECSSDKLSSATPTTLNILEKLRENIDLTGGKKFVPYKTFAVKSSKQKYSFRSAKAFTLTKYELEAENLLLRNMTSEEEVIIECAPEQSTSVLKKIDFDNDEECKRSNTSKTLHIAQEQIMIPLHESDYDLQLLNEDYNKNRSKKFRKHEGKKTSRTCCSM